QPVRERTPGRGLVPISPHPGGRRRESSQRRGTVRGAVQHEQSIAPVQGGWRIVSVQPDREHAFIEGIGACGLGGAAELRRRVDGLLIAGVRYVLVDLTGAENVAPTTSAALAAAGRQLARRRGWLKTIGHGASSAARYQASLPDVFAMYQAAVRRGVVG